MAKTLQPERPGHNRRKRNRREHVMLNDEERVIFQHWYACLFNVLNKELRKDKAKLFIYKPTNKDCALPIDAVREELRHIFCADWKCDVCFNDIDKTVHLRDLR